MGLCGSVPGKLLFLSEAAPSGGYGRKDVADVDLGGGAGIGDERESAADLAEAALLECS